MKKVGPAPSRFDRYDFGPVVDGTVLPGHPFDPRATSVSADIPVLVGGVKDEMAIFLAPDDKVWQRTLTEDELRARVVPAAGSSTDRVLETYRRLFPAANPAERLISITTDANFRLRGPRARMALRLRLGDASAGRQAQILPCARRAVRVRDG